MLRRFLVSILAAFTLTAYSGLFGQVATGTPSFDSFGGGPFDSIDLGNLNIHFSIPIIHKAGRGMPFDYALSYDGSVWTPTTVNGQKTWQPAFNWGWSAQTAIKFGYISFLKITQKCDFPPPQTGTYTIWSGFAYHDPWGGVHNFIGTLEADPKNCDNGNTPSFAETTTDGSGYTLNATYTTDTITTKSGQVLTPPLNQAAGYSSGTYSATDANGNQISVSTTTGSATFTDTLGQTALTVSGTSPVTFVYTAPSGGPAQYTMNYVQYTGRTNFGVSGINEYGPLSNPLVDNIQLPDGTKYSFTYEKTPGSCTPLSGTYSGYCVTGRLASVTLPAGGVITYQYSGGVNGTGIFSDGSTGTLTRILAASTSCTGPCWQYARTLASGTPGPGSGWTTTVIDPSGNNAVINFAEDGNATKPTYFLYETQRQAYQGAISPNNLLATTTNCWNNNFSGCSTQAVSSPITKVDHYRSLPGVTYAAVSETYYNSYGLLTEDKEIDYVAAPNGSPYLRDTLVVYAPLGNNIYDRIASITVNGPSGTTVGRTSYSYDQGALTATSGTPQHVSMTGSRGNLTTVIMSTTGTATISKTFTYYDTGNVNVATDVNGQQTTYVYGSGSCGNSFTTTINEPLALSRSITWNCTGGVSTQVTDENRNNVTVTYNDPYFWRPAYTSYPDGGQISLTYNTQSTPWNFVTTSKINGSSNLTTESVVDGFGRVTTNETTSDPAGTVYTATAYDNVGRIASISNPYRSTSDPTYGITQQGYDGLNRVTQITNPDNSIVQVSYAGRARKVQNEAGVTKIYQQDGLGRLVSVCEVTNVSQMGTAPGACGQDIPATGFLTSYTYDALGNLTGVSQGAQSRSYQYDGLSRLTSESNPEWNGTISYTYDTNTAGDLYQRVRPAPNQTGLGTVTATYTYDALHRLTSTSYSDGSTPSVGLSYDQSSLYGVTLYNSKGRLTNAASGSADTIISYDKLGHIAQEWQCTPYNCGTGSFPVAYSYDYLGDMTSSSNGVGVTSTLNYNTAAQLTSFTSSLSDSNHPGTLVSNAQYNALGEPTSDSLGNGLSEAWTYDKNGRIISYTSAAYAFGNGMNWSGAELKFAGDSLNGDWTFGYDDFGRLATASCSVSGCTPASFSYAYDRFGNRWQQNVTSGSGPAPQYTFNGNNRPTSFTYDAAGNILNDGSHSYTYDAENRLIKVDGGSTATYVYDALGNRVYKTTTAGSVSLIYDLAGHQVAEVNSSGGWNRGEVYAGSRHWATYNNSTTYFPLVDWLGTTRMITDVSGNRVEHCINLPFGDGRNCSGSAYDLLQFTGQANDSETGLDHFLFRQYSGTQGSWISPDPAGLAAVDPGNPQTWNRYAYVGNSPLNSVDPFGLAGQCKPDTCTDPHQNDDLARQFNYSCGTLEGVPVDCQFFNALYATGATVICPQCLPGQLVGQDNKIYGYTPPSTYSYWASPDDSWRFGITTGGWGIVGSVSPNSDDPYAKSPLSQFLKKLIFRPYSFGILLPIAIPAGPAGTLSFDLDKGFVCLGVGGGVGARGVNGGPLWGDTQKSGDILSGWSVSLNVAGPIGAQIIQNLSGKLYGPTVGAPGASLAVTYSWCSGK